MEMLLPLLQKLSGVTCRDVLSPIYKYLSVSINIYLYLLPRQLSDGTRRCVLATIGDTQRYLDRRLQFWEQTAARPGDK